MALDNAKSSERSKTWTPEPAPLESQAEKLIRKSKKDPFIPIGFAGLAAACAYGVYGYRNRGPAMTTSRYLMRLRVIAQSCVVGAILVGVGYSALSNKDEQSKR